MFFNYHKSMQTLYKKFYLCPLKIKIMENYKIPKQTKIGHVHLKVSNLDKALSFYRDLLELEVTQYFGEDAVFLSAGGYHHHIALNTWYSKDAPKASPNTVGLYHVAFLYPTRRDLALIVKRLKDIIQLLEEQIMGFLRRYTLQILMGME